MGRAGLVRRVGHLIFKKKMPESFAHERCLDHLMRNFMSEASSGYFAFCKAHREGQRPRCPIRRHTGNEDVAPPVWLNPVQSSLPMVWLNSARSSQGGVSPPLNQAELRDGRRRCCTGRPEIGTAFRRIRPLIAKQSRADRLLTGAANECRLKGGTRRHHPTHHHAERN